MNLFKKIKYLFSKKQISQNKFIFPFIPKNNKICEKRRDFLKDFSISPDYHLAILAYIDENFGLKGKRVLELGGSNIPREIIIDDFGVKQYIGVDYIESWWPDPNHKKETVIPMGDLLKVFSSDEPYFIFSGSVNDLPDDFLSDKFDIIISFSSIEHFNDIPLMLKKAHNVLKKGGYYFATSEPVWSSGKGHHFWISPDYNFQVTSDFDFAHLLYSKEEFLEKFKSKREIDVVAEKIYDWDGINRLFYKDIESAVYSSDFSNKVIYPFILQKPPASILDALRVKNGNKINSDNDFSIRGIQWILEK
jgi:SAM-dependent methyltransferase